MSNKLVAYFSASGVTADIAKRLAELAGADLFEIVPKVPYTEEDLNWEDEKCRSTLEMKTRTARPEIAGRVENMEQYDTVFVGFPIWWYNEPVIIDTFMESYDFSGKKVIPFATSGGSGMGRCGRDMQKLAPGSTVEKGRRFGSGVADEALKEWLGTV